MNRLWYEKAAAGWNEALPLGNGFMGAMCFGGNVIDRFQLNLDSLWHGGFRDRVNPDSKANIPEIQRLIAAGEIRKAEKLAELAMAAVPDYQCHYEPLCDLFLIPETGADIMLFGLRDGWNPQIYTTLPCSGYTRSLDIDSGIHTVSYTLDGVPHRRESFISNPDRVMVIRCEGAPLSVITERGVFLQEFSRPDENTVCIQGQAGSDGVRYCFAVRAVSGSLGVTGRTLRCSGDCVLIAAGETSFYSSDPYSAVMSATERAAEKGFGLLK
ncbi:MAG: glycoside hydrolase family 95 protein [Ruminiclostridium sp.]|nr:glycoside hydrolase family 95 protein [Ruminiclostridium sp.]